MEKKKGENLPKKGSLEHDVRRIAEALEKIATEHVHLLKGIEFLHADLVGIREAIDQIGV